MDPRAFLGRCFHGSEKIFGELFPWIRGDFLGRCFLEFKGIYGAEVRGWGQQPHKWRPQAFSLFCQRGRGIPSHSSPLSQSSSTRAPCVKGKPEQDKQQSRG